MKYLNLHPELLEMADAECLAKIPFRIIYNNLDSIINYYNDKLSLADILNHYADSDIFSGDVEKQVTCVLPSHGTLDRNKSARYYSINKETGLKDERVYCFKCLSSLTAFGFLYNYNKAYKNFTTMKEFFLLIQERWSIKFPFQIVFEFDEDLFYTFDDSPQSVKLKGLYEYGEKTLRPLFELDREQFVKLSKEFFG